MEGEGEMTTNETLVPRGPERRSEGRRFIDDRRIGERRDPVRATAGRRVIHPFERRIAERRALDRRGSWPDPTL